MGCSSSRKKIVPISPELEITNLLHKYNTFVNDFLLSPTKKSLTKELCKNHKAMHELYHILREKIVNKELYDVQFKYIYNRFVDELIELYENGKLEIDVELMKTEQIQKMFNIRKIEAPLSPR
jgi:hypothetical protein